MKKYELLKDDFKMTKDGTKLYRVCAVIDLPFTDEQLGGYIESEDNLSQDGNAWVRPGAYVMGNAKIIDGACVQGDDKDIALIKDNAIISGKAFVTSGMVKGNAIITDDASVIGAKVSENAVISGCAKIHGKGVYISGNAKVTDVARITAVSNISKVYDDAVVCGKAIVHESTVCGNAVVQDEALVNCCAIIKGRAVVGGNAIVSAAIIMDDAMVIEDAVVRGKYGFFRNTPTIQGNTVLKGTTQVRGFKIIKDNESIIVDWQGRQVASHAMGTEDFCSLYEKQYGEGDGKEKITDEPEL